MEQISIDPGVLSRQVSEIGNLAEEANSIYTLHQTGTLSAAYSEVSGLDQMGASHGLVMQGGVGSAVATLQKFAEQVSWLRDGLRATEKSLTSQETLASAALGIADEGGVVGEELHVFPSRPDQVFEDFDFPAPSVTIPSSISELSAAFAGTDNGAVVSSAESWDAMSKNASVLAENIRTTAWDIAEINKADSINVAVDRALEVADAADIFATNAGLMSTSVTYMGQVATAGAMQVSLAELAIAFIEDPAERAAAERAFLDSFMGSTFPSAVESAMPVIRNLMSLEQTGSGGSELQASMGLVDGNGRPGPVAKLNAGSQEIEKLISNPSRIGPGSFGEVASNVAALDNVGSAGASGIGGLGTSAAHALGGGFGGISPVGNLAGGVTPNMPTGTAGITPVGALGFTPGANNPQVASRAGNSPWSGTSPFGSHRPDLSNAPTTAASAGPSSFGGSGGGAGGPLGVPVGGRGGAAGQQKIDKVLSPGFGTGSSASTAHAAPTPAATAAAMARPGMPMGGVPFGAAQQENKRGKVKTVTSAVEEEGNLSALLGDLPPVVPGPIGAWARG